VAYVQLNAQVGIGTEEPRGALEINSTTGGLVLPRMTTAQRDLLPTTTPAGAVRGTIIYNLDNDYVERYDGQNWLSIGLVTEVDWSSLVNMPADFADGVDNVEDDDSDPTNEIQTAEEVLLEQPIVVDNDVAVNVEEALNLMMDTRPKGTFKSIGEARAAGLQDGDSFYTHPLGVFGCSACIITLQAGMN